VCAPVNAAKAPLEAIAPSPLRSAIVSNVSAVLFFALFAASSRSVWKDRRLDDKLVAIAILSSGNGLIALLIPDSNDFFVGRGAGDGSGAADSDSGSRTSVLLRPHTVPTG
jgi:hypothetical protein